VNKNHIIPVPKNISVEDVHIKFMIFYLFSKVKAAGIPEVWLTAYLNILLGEL